MGVLQHVRAGKVQSYHISRSLNGAIVCMYCCRNAKPQLPLPFLCAFLFSLEHLNRKLRRFVFCLFSLDCCYFS